MSTLQNLLAWYSEQAPCVTTQKESNTHLPQLHREGTVLDSIFGCMDTETCARAADLLAVGSSAVSRTALVQLASTPGTWKPVPHAVNLYLALLCIVCRKSNSPPREQAPKAASKRPGRRAQRSLFHQNQHTEPHLPSEFPTLLLTPSWTLHCLPELRALATAAVMAQAIPNPAHSFQR